MKFYEARRRGKFVAGAWRNDKESVWNLIAEWFQDRLAIYVDGRLLIDAEKLSDDIEPKEPNNH